MRKTAKHPGLAAPYTGHVPKRPMSVAEVYEAAARAVSENTAELIGAPYTATLVYIDLTDGTVYRGAGDWSPDYPDGTFYGEHEWIRDHAEPCPGLDGGRS